jgi:multiple sugar transport system permease protein
MGNAVSVWRKYNRQGDMTAAMLSLAPAVIVFGIFNIFPLIYTMYLSLLDWDGLSIQKLFVGLENYRELLTSDLLWNSIKVTIYYTTGIIMLSIPLALLVAFLLNSGIRAQPFYRTLYFLPVVTATVAVAVVWKIILDPGSGYVNVILRQAGISGPSWLRSPIWAMPAVILVGVWKRLGFNMVIYLAALQSIPREYYEAAEVDGAGRLSVFRHITIPLLQPITALLIVLALIDSFLLFDQVYVMTGGGPAGATDVIGFLLYRQAFRYFNLGKASSIAWIMFLIIASATFIQWRLTRFGTKGVT